MNDLENKLEKFKSVLDPVTKGMTFSRKEYINKLFLEIISEVNAKEIELNSFKARILGFSNQEEYIDALTKAINLLQAIGFTSIDFTTMRKDIIDWVIENQKGMSKDLTVKTFTTTYKWVNHFWLFNERFPIDTTELKEYINTFVNDRSE